MRLLIVLLAVFTVSSAIDIPNIPLPIPLPIKIPDFPLPLNPTDLNPAKLLELFQKFIAEFKKVYLNPILQSKALSAFSGNVKKIVQLQLANKGKNVTFGVNEFSDLTNEEFAAKMLQKTLSFNSSSFARTPQKTKFSATDYGSLPASYDWRTYANVVGPVRNQGSCGCCWAFTTAAIIQSAYGVRNKKLIQPSEQQICDCGMMDSRPGCNGGNVGVALEYAMQRGISLESAYTAYSPTRATKANVCDDKNKPNTIKISEFDYVANTEKDIQTAIYLHGLVGMGFEVGESFRHYKSGVFTNTDCKSPATFLGCHAVAVAGWGEEKGVRYWIVKNSWGPSYGESGYIRFQRGVNLCSIESDEVVYVDT